MIALPQQFFKLKTFFLKSEILIQSKVLPPLLHADFHSSLFYFTTWPICLSVWSVWRGYKTYYLLPLINSYFWQQVVINDFLLLWDAQWEKIAMKLHISCITLLWIAQAVYVEPFFPSGLPHVLCHTFDMKKSRVFESEFRPLCLYKAMSLIHLEKS